MNDQMERKVFTSQQRRSSLTDGPPPPQEDLTADSHISNLGGFNQSTAGCLIQALVVWLHADVPKQTHWQGREHHHAVASVLMPKCKSWEHDRQPKLTHLLATPKKAAEVLELPATPPLQLEE